MRPFARTSVLFFESQICGNQPVKAFSISRKFYDSEKSISTDKNEGKSVEREPTDHSLLDDLSEPTTCCMSGCANCVWIQYAEKLSNTLQNSETDIQKMIMEKIQDPNMRAFLTMELRCRNLIK